MESPSGSDAARTDQTFLVATSPHAAARRRRRRSSNNSLDAYRPKIISTVGQRPAVLVSASVTYVGSNEIYAFGGFDQYTDEVYNHVLRLNLDTRQWNLVDNYGDIPGVRMGHSATLWQGDKVLIFGGENEHRAYLSDVIVFDLKTAHWTQPDIYGTPPRSRARHSATIYDDKLFVVGGLCGLDNATILDDFCFLDLRTWTWSRTWRFVARFDHTSWVWGNRLWVYGGLTEGTKSVADLWWLDLKQSLMVSGPLRMGRQRRSTAAGAAGGGTSKHSRPLYQAQTHHHHHQHHHNAPPSTAATTTTHPPAPPPSTGYAANSSSIQVAQASQPPTRRLPMAPGAVSSVSFVSGPNVPAQSMGREFCAYSSGCMLNFTTPLVTGAVDSNLCALELDTMRWQKLADGRDLFYPGYTWHYCTLNEEGTRAWLLGTSAELQPAAANNNNNAAAGAGSNEYLSDVLSIDLRKLGLLGNSMVADPGSSEGERAPSDDMGGGGPLVGLGADLARMFDQAPEAGSGADFVVTGVRGDESEGEGEGEGEGEDVDVDIDDDDDDDDDDDRPARPGYHSAATRGAGPPSRPIHVHRLILEARWPHFARMLGAQMNEFHTRKLHIPERYSVVRAFLRYLYTDRISEGEQGPGLDDVAGMLVMANIYDVPRLRLLCRNRLGRELDIEHAATVWEHAGLANEDWLQRRAARFCMVHWGRIVRTAGFLRLRRTSMMELCQEIDTEGRVVGADELEAVGGLGGARIGGGGQQQHQQQHQQHQHGASRARNGSSAGHNDDDDDDDESMDL